MRTVYRHEGDGWSPDGKKINSPENLQAIQACLENEGPIIVEHWHYRGSRSPDRFVFDYYEAFVEYLDENCFAGDSLHVWSFSPAVP